MKKLVFFLSAAIVALALTGCSSTVSGDVLNSINNAKQILITDDTAAAGYWNPKDQNSVMSEVTGWLKEAKPYKGTVPQTEGTGDKVAGNIWPSTLHISGTLTISPACALSSEKQSFKIRYVENVILLDKSGEKSYWESKELYDWLKNDKWEPEFQKE